MWPLPNVWLGVSAERQQEADERIPELLATPAAIRFVSAEPLLGPIDFKRITHHDPVKFSWLTYSPTLNALTGNYPVLESDRTPHPDRLDWIIVGGESGPDARPMHPAWPRAIRDQCAAAGVPFFFKQWGAWGCAQIRPSGTSGNYAIASAPPYSDFMPAMMIPTDHYPRQFTLFGGATVRELVGKKAAGRLLDGVEHNGMPNIATTGETR